jgi:hypothetical protein
MKEGHAVDSVSRTGVVNQFIRKSIIRKRGFIRKEVECSVVECQPADNGSWRSDRLVNQNQVSHSGREDTRSPVRNGASLRQSLIVSCYNLLYVRVIVIEVPINPIIQSRTRYYPSQNPGHLTIYICRPTCVYKAKLSLYLTMPWKHMVDAKYYNSTILNLCTR